MAPKILVVDDELLVRRTLVQMLQELGHAAAAVGSAEEALAHLAGAPCGLVLADLKLPGMSGLDLLRQARSHHPETRFVLITGHGSVELAVQAMQEGALDFLAKPFSLTRLREVLERGLGSADARDAGSLANIVTEDPRMLALLATTARVAQSRAPVLIQGESGTGKELLARELHLRSPRRDRPFVAVNCAAVPEALLESELFGHERGAFTGAVARRLGKFEAAHQGTLLLDEVSETTPAFQAKLLRALQQGELDRVGRDRPVQVDVRIVATTNRDLREELQAGRFRQDLFFRLNVIALRLPPLRERPGDIPRLVRHFLEKHRTPDVQARGVSPDALRHLQSYPWPGNIRELESCLQRALLLCQESMVQPSHLQLDPQFLAPPLDTGKRSEVERRLILATLDRVGGNRNRAADALGVSVRTIRNRLRQYREEAGRLPAAASMA